jgi:hypothetical protein
LIFLGRVTAASDARDGVTLLAFAQIEKRDGIQQMGTLM